MLPKQWGTDLTTFSHKKHRLESILGANGIRGDNLMGQEDKAASTGTRRGFAALNAEQRRRIASMGGKAAHEKGTAHEFTSEEAAAAGRRRGQGAKRREAQVATPNNDVAELVPNQRPMLPVSIASNM
jgi:hypothetical protein